MSAREALKSSVENKWVLIGLKLLKGDIKDVFRILSKAQKQLKPTIAQLSNAGAHPGLISSKMKNKNSLVIHEIDSNLVGGAVYGNQNQSMDTYLRMISVEEIIRS